MSTSLPTAHRRATTVYTISQPTCRPDSLLDLWQERATAAEVEFTGSGYTEDGAYIRVRLLTDDARATEFAYEVLKACGFQVHIGVGAGRTEIHYDDWLSRDKSVLREVMAERIRQHRHYGHVNRGLADGTGPDVQWLGVGDPYLADRAAVGIERAVRSEYERYERTNGGVDRMRLVREEVAEAFKESDPTRLAEELTQVAALCIGWVADLRVASPEQRQKILAETPTED